MPVMVGVDEQGPFRNSDNGLLTQNVLVACSFDLRFRYVLAGWEGSASDQQVLNAALTRPNNLQVPLGSMCIYLFLFLEGQSVTTFMCVQESTILWTVSTRIFRDL